MRHSVKLTLAVLLSVQLSFGAIAHDADSASSAQTTSTSYNWSHTITGSNVYLWVGVNIRGTSCTVSGITWNSSENLALVTSAAATNGSRSVESWGLVNPTTGTHTVAVTLTGCTPTASMGCATSFTGVVQSSSTEAGNGATASSSSGPEQVTITSSTDNTFMVVNGITGSFTTSTAANSGQTQTQDITLSGSFHASCGYTTAAVTPAGAVSMGFALTGPSSNDSWAVSGFAIKPATASTGGNSSRSWVME